MERVLKLARSASWRQLAISEAACRSAAFLFLVFVYLVFAPNSHYTVVDAYAFANMIENGAIGDVPSRLFLWVTSFQLLFDATSIIVPGIDAFSFAAVLNAMLSALAVILLERLLSGPFGLNRRASVATAFLFAFSYGTWRYATEVEVYASVAVMVVGLFLISFRVQNRMQHLVGLAFLGVLASLAYQPLGLLAGAAIPLYLFLKFGIRSGIIYFGSFVAMVVPGLFLVRYWTLTLNTKATTALLNTDGKLPDLPSLGDMVRAVVAASQNLLSVNGLYAFEPLHRVLHGDPGVIYATQDMHWSALIFVATLSVLVALLGFVIVALRNNGPMSPFSLEEICVVFLLGIYAIVLVALAPGGFEGWLPLLVPLVLILGTRLVASLFEAGKSWIVVTVAVIFVAHNWFSGVAVLAWSERDLGAARGQALMLNASEEDMILVSDWKFGRYLDYNHDADIRLVGAMTNAELQGAIVTTIEDGNAVLIVGRANTRVIEALEASEDFGIWRAALGIERVLELGDGGKARVLALRQPDLMSSVSAPAQ